MILEYKSEITITVPETFGIRGDVIRFAKITKWSDYFFIVLWLEFLGTVWCGSDWFCKCFGKVQFLQRYTFFVSASKFQR